MRRVVCLAGLAAALVAFAQAPAPLRFEVEEWTEPKDAWIADRMTADHWCLWSTDQDAQKKWSKGVVLRSPEVKEDRAKGEDGAPVLHTKITGIPNGFYDVVMNGGRLIGLSFDNQTWAPSKGGTIAAGHEITDGTFELWVDDRYTTTEGPGPCYYDYLEFRPTMPMKFGVKNGGFEVVDGDKPAAWAWWSREAVGGAVPTTEVKHSGERSVKITHEGTKDFAFSCSGRLKVKPGDQFTLRGWFKCQEARSIGVFAVANGGGKLVTWDCGSEDTSGAGDWTELSADVLVPEGADEIYVRVVGQGKVIAWVDDISLAPGKKPVVQKPKVEGAAKARVPEKMDRGLVALRGDGGVTVGWRLLRSDPPDVAFNVYRHVAGRPAARINQQPLRQTCDLLDHSAPGDSPVRYSVRAVVGGKEGKDEGSATTNPNDPAGYVAIKLDAGETVQKVGIADLDGDGRCDYVIKQPHHNIDPHESYWEKSPDTYQIEAWTHDGKRLWRNDLGPAIERGIWYSPYIVWDFDGDGKAEVAAKIGEGDPRDADGRVRTGPEWVVVWDGLTGQERARAPWPNREGFTGSDGGYNLASRNQLAVAYLDGKTPCLIVLRGTYTTMKADAYELRGKTLRPLWTYHNKEGGAKYRGQGAHFTQCVDVDGDGRDEIVLGSAVIDDNGVPLWSTGRGHPDAAYTCDILPGRPGLEIGYVMETRQQKNGLAVVDARTGQTLWGLDKPTGHVHGKGICSDISPLHPGVELYGADSADHKPTGERWLYTASGELLSTEENYSFGWRTCYWDADLQRELIAGREPRDHGGGPVGSRFEGSLVQVADILGDWREEVICSLPGELRIYSTTIPATDRRVCLMQDPIYRLDTAMNAMGYTQEPVLSYLPEALAPNLNLTAVPAADETATVRVVAVAPLDRAVTGEVALTADGATLAPATFAVDLAPGQRLVQSVKVTADGGRRPVTVKASLTGPGVSLTGRVTTVVTDRPLSGVPLAQAEAFSAQGGGEVQKRSDKPGVVGGAISHWDSQGHWLEWRLTVPKAGDYRLVVRYSAASTALRAVKLDSADLPRQTFPETGGFGDQANEWAHRDLRAADGQPMLVPLTAGEHVLRLENLDGKGLNLDYLAVVGK